MVQNRLTEFLQNFPKDSLFRKYSATGYICTRVNTKNQIVQLSWEIAIISVMKLPKKYHYYHKYKNAIIKKLVIVIIYLQ